MSTGEGEAAAQPANAEEAAREDIQRFFDAWDTAQDRELNRIDAALAAVEAADSREAAVAALTRATVGINALFASTPVAPSLEVISPSFNLPGRSSVIYPYFLFGRSDAEKAEKDERKRGERIEKYLKVANDLVEKYGPDQYQLSVGFPLLISVTLTWNIKKE